MKKSIVMFLVLPVCVSASSMTEMEALGILGGTYTNWCVNAPFFDCSEPADQLYSALMRLSKSATNDTTLSSWYVDVIGLSVSTNLETRSDNYGIVLPTGVPQHIAIKGFNLWMGIKGGLLEEAAAFVEGSTNVLQALAEEHGTAVINLVPPERNETPVTPTSQRIVDGVLVAGYSQQDYQELCNRQVRDRAESALRGPWMGYKRSVYHAFEKQFADSTLFSSMPSVERNTIVSNLVEAARFTPDEAAALGLTNVVEAVSGK